METLILSCLNLGLLDTTGWASPLAPGGEHFIKMVCWAFWWGVAFSIGVIPTLIAVFYILAITVMLINHK